MTMNKEKHLDQEKEAAKNRKILKIVCSILVAIGIWLYVDEEKAVDALAELIENL